MYLVLTRLFFSSTKLMSEINSFVAGALGFYKDVPSFRPLPLSTTSTGRALDEVREFLAMIKTYEAAGDGFVGETPTPVDGFDLEAYAMKIMTCSPASLAAELSAYDVKYPCLYVTAGSAFSGNVVSVKGITQLHCSFLLYISLLDTRYKKRQTEPRIYVLIIIVIIISGQFTTRRKWWFGPPHQVRVDI